MNVIKINFYDKQLSLSVFLNDCFDENWNNPGVYVWVWRGLIWYVGKSVSNVWDRNAYHAIMQISGLYSIPHELTPEKCRDENKGWRGKNYSSVRLLSVYRDEVLRNELIKSCSDFADEVQVYCVQIDSIVNRQSLGSVVTDLEAVLINKLKPLDNRRKENVKYNSVFSCLDTLIEQLHAEIGRDQVPDEPGVEDSVGKLMDNYRDSSDNE